MNQSSLDTVLQMLKKNYERMGRNVGRQGRRSEHITAGWHRDTHWMGGGNPRRCTMEMLGSSLSGGPPQLGGVPRKPEGHPKTKVEPPQKKVNEYTERDHCLMLSVT